MEHNPHLVKRLTAIQSALMAQHMGGLGLPNAMAGSERETFLREFLQKLFPAHRRFASGAITDSAGKLSGQVDIAVEYGLIPSFPMPSSEERLFLAESVAMVIEVKSDLGDQWCQVQQTVKHVKALKRDLNPVVTLGDALPSTIPCFAVGYRGHSTISGLSQRLAATPESERPDAALVIESGCFCGYGIESSGALGLYALSIVINHHFAQLTFAAPNLLLYVQS